jgi:hypothetical protein
MVSVYQLDVCNGSLGDEIEAHQFLPLWDRKAGIALPSFLCPAAIGLIGPLYPA